MRETAGRWGSEVVGYVERAAQKVVGGEDVHEEVLWELPELAVNHGDQVNEENRINFGKI